MMLQFEITTRCNFDCFYCAGRAMRQGDMPFAMFTELLDRHIARHGTPTSVSLQGEGEPTLHHDFFRMAEQVRAVGSTPYTITNGTHKHPGRFVGLFPQIGVSIDTLDASTAALIGRYNLPRVLEFVEALASHVVMVIHSVAHPVHTPPIARWCQEKGYRHVVQPLQQKPDYSRHYLKDVQVPAPRGRFACVYLETPRMRYYTLDGSEMPCCFIKDGGAFEGMDTMLRHQQNGTWPAVCLGCRYARDSLAPQQQHADPPGGQ
jgi:MoaA/NifB/PqqE/SkfB family radical SAM enzyme